MKKKMWCVYFEDENANREYWWSTISYYRKDSIRHFLANSNISWKEARSKYGYGVQKVLITIEPI